MTGSRRDRFGRSDSGERTCFEHIGTHKTGTTTLQHFLCRHAAQLAELGIYVPVSGRLNDAAEGSGHHCIAWDLLGSEATDPIRGILEQLIAELQHCSAPTVCVSSEEFVHLHVAANKLQRLRAGLAGIGYRPVLVVYLRPQADYLEALYAEVSRHAAVRDFWECYREMLAHGAADLWPGSRFTTMFDYERLIAAFIPIVGPRNIAVRAFRRNRAATMLVRDFIRVVAEHHARPISGSWAPTGMHNSGVAFGVVLEWIRANREGRRAFAVLPSPAAAAGPFDPLRAHEMFEIGRRFGMSNLRIFLRHRVWVGCVSRHSLVRAVRSMLVADPKRERFALLRGEFPLS